MNNQEFHRWYKRLIEHPPEDPPNIVWEGISLELDREFYDWYQHTIEEPSEEPPEEIWNNIQDELDINDTWGRISYRLNRAWKKRTQRLVYALAAAALVLFMLQIFLPGGEQSPFEESQTTPIAREEGKESPTANEDQATPKNRDTEKVPDIHKDAATREAEKHEQIAVTEDISSTDQAGDNTSPPQMKLAKASPVTVSLEVDYSTQPAALPDSRTTVTELQPAGQEASRVKYYAGINGEVGTTWLMSSKTLYSIRKSPYSSASPDLGKSYGAMAGASLNNKLDVQAEALFTSETGQKYREYSDGQVMDNQIQLNYSSLKLTGRYEIFGSSFQLPVSHHLVAGIYVSYLKNAKQISNGAAENISGAYKNYNLGMVAGYELDTHISPNYSLSLGLRFNPGFINIYEGTSLMPAQFNKTYSSSVNVNIALKYNLSGQ